MLLSFLFKMYVNAVHIFNISTMELCWLKTVMNYLSHPSSFAVKKENRDNKLTYSQFMHEFSIPYFMQSLTRLLYLSQLWSIRCYWSQMQNKNLLKFIQRLCWQIRRLSIKIFFTS